jgi:hypothetical protein
MVEPSGDVLLLTYVELGERLGVAPDTARLRAKRRGWEVQHGNDGKARVRVPSGDVPDVPPERPRRNPDDALTVEGLLTELRETQADAADARQEAAVAMARLEGAERAHTAEVAALRELMVELHKLLDDARRPWWRRWLNQS